MRTPPNLKVVARGVDFAVRGTDGLRADVEVGIFGEACNARELEGALQDARARLLNVFNGFGAVDIV